MIRIATRGSALALAQAGQVAALLGGGELVEVSSDGESGDKARFVRGVELALLEGRADIGVHSAKDLPGEMPEGLVIAAVPVREDPADVWIGADGAEKSDPPEGEATGALDSVPAGARVGTASLRRRAQLLAARPDLEVSELHGNVDTRLRKLAHGELDAIILAAAGLRRLGREGEASFAIPPEAMIPAAGQGALVLQAREDDAAAIEAAAAIGDVTALRELTAERAVVALLEATCATPIGVHARVAGHAARNEPGDEADAAPGAASRSGPEARVGDGSLVIEGFVGLPDGSEWIRDRVEGEGDDPAAAGALLAERLLAAGARDILGRAEEWRRASA
jgi:hydroxymethylbilane synthase